MKVINLRYKIERLISKDACGSIYLAKDIHHFDRLVYLKLFNSDYSKSDLIDKLIADFMFYKSVKHPCITQLFEFDRVTSIDNKTANRLNFFYTYEYLGDQDPIDYRELNTEESKLVFVEILRAVAYLHFRGLVYKYLNFTNVRIYSINKQIVVKLNDLVSVEHFKEVFNVNDHRSSLFMPAEVVWNQQFDFSSDLYALGHLLYYIHYKYDLDSKNIAEIYDRDIQDDNELNRLIRQMVGNYFEDRYYDMNALMKDYATIQRMKLPESDLEYYNKLHFGTKLIGREKDFEEIYNTITNKIDKKSSNIGAVLTGESGIGKTRLLKELAYVLKMHSYEAYYIEAIENKADSFYIFQSVIRGIIRNNDLSLDLKMKYGSELAKIVPEIITKWKVSPSDVLEGERESLKLANRIFNFIQDYSQHHHFVLIIDNIEYADQYDLIVLDYLFRNNKDSYIYILASANKATVDDSVAKHLWSDSGKVLDYQISKFNYDDANQLIMHILGTNKRMINFTARIMKDAEGNPRVIEEMIQNMYLNKKIHIGSNHRWHLADIDQMDAIQIEAIHDQALMASLENIDDYTQEILNVTSLFNDAIGMEVLKQMIPDEKRLHDSVTRLIELNMFSEKFGDFGYTYNFNNRNIAELIREKIKPEQKIQYHKALAAILEKEVIEQGGFVTETLISHYAFSNQIDKAVEYCFIAAERMKSINIYSQAITFYKRAIELRQKNNQEVKIPEILLKIGEIHKILGQFLEAILIYEEASKISEIHQVKTCYIDAINELTQLCVIKSEITRAYNFYTEAMRLSVENNYKAGELQAALNLNKIQRATNDMIGCQTVALKYIEVARAFEDKKYEALFENELGIYESYFGSYEKSLEHFNVSYQILSYIGEEDECMKPLNNMGVIYLEQLADVAKARVYFEKVLTYFNNFNIIHGKPMTLSNIGETYSIEGRYDLAMDYYNQAYKLVEDSPNDDVNFMLLINICNTHIATGEYDKAYLVIKKLEVDYQNNKHRGLDSIMYYITHVEYFLMIKNFDLAERWLNYYKNFEIDSPETLDSLMSIVEFKLKHQRLNYLSSNKTIDMDQLKVLIQGAHSGSNIQKIRSVINDLAIELINARKFILVQELMALESKYLDRFDSKNLSLRRHLTQSYFENNRIERFEDILVQSRSDIMDEDAWLVYKALGDEYFYKSNYFKAISNYMMAIDCLQRLCNKIPAPYRDSYILNDENKLDLKYRVNELKRRIAGNRFSNENYGFGDYEVSSADDYFDMTDLVNLYKNQKFLKTVQQIYAAKFETQFEDINDLIKYFQSDELFNIKQMLIYFVQYCFADSGYVVLSDEQGDIYETIKSESHLGQPDLSAVMKHLATEDDGLVISFIENNIHSPLLPHGKKGIICIPIAKTASDELLQGEVERRKRNDMINRKDRLGYIYLETENIFNNFSKQSYDHCKSLMNLLYVMIDNYNLKKLSTIDKLTGVYLRKYFEEMFSIELNRSKNSVSTMSLVMCDIDKFKSVNDNFGHRKGDEVLKKIGSILTDRFRATDLVGRYGGEEFIILLPRTELNEAKDACEKIRKYIEAEQLMGADYPLTMSFGISTYPEHGVNEEELIEKADQALYYSKNSGRNKTTLWDPNIGNESVRFDKLAGILTGNMSKDTRNIQAMVTVLNALKEPIQKDEKLKVLMTNLLDITEARYAAVALFENMKQTRLYTQDRVGEGFQESIALDQALFENFMYKETGEFFINWSDISEAEIERGIPNWKSVIVVPVTVSETLKVVLVLSVPIDEKEFDFGDFNYVNAMSGLVSVVV